jgi:flagellin
MTAINTNVGALNARRAAATANTSAEKAMERLSSGLRVNNAGDDAAGLAVAGKMTNQLRGINMGIRNAQDGIGLIQTAEAGLNEIKNMVLRMRELAVQMSNGIYEDSPDRANADLEVKALHTQIDLIANNTKFNDVALLNGASFVIQAGSTTAETVNITIASLKASGLGLTAATNDTAASGNVSVSQITAATTAIGYLDAALSNLATAQANLGSLQNRLSYSIANLTRASVTTETAVGRIMDADFAQETTNLSKQQILSQAATSMLAQANQSKQSILALLQ